MSRLIDADALMQTLGITDIDCDKCAWGDKKRSRCKRGGDFEDACFAIYSAPTIEERKKGKWIPQDLNKTNGMASTAVYYYPKCSVCGHCANYTNFCPNCGADMRGEQDEHNH